jgi:amino acid adenylation domain-containing protein
MQENIRNGPLGLIKPVLPTLRPPEGHASIGEELLNLSLVSRFERIVQKYGNNIAVSSKGQTITYTQLNQAANRLARAILDARGPGLEPVALLLDHHIPAIEAIWGVLKAGKAFVVLDPSLPVERLRLILEDVQTSLLITNHLQEAKGKTILPDYASVTLLNLDTIDSTRSFPNPNLDIALQTAADIVYTSGTTGRPKGVIKTHQSVMHNTLVHLIDIYISPNDRMALTVFIGFDVALFNIFGTLLFGASLYMYDVRSEGIGHLVEWIKAERISIMFSLPSSFRHLFDLYTNKYQIPSVRVVFLGGEPTSRFDVELYRQHFSTDCILVTALGSTEAGRIARYGLNHRTQIPGYLVPAGFPDAGKTILVVDESGQPVKPGQVGEIWIRSRYISPGYWNNQELTAKKFLIDPQDPELRTFCTGDLGLLRSNGMLEHQGRKDSQVKIRGYRVEVTEIEGVIHQHPTVKATAVVARSNPRLPDEKQLVAYVVSNPNEHLRKNELRSFLVERLPDYSVPSIFIFLDQLPYTSTGKVDNQALPNPEDMGQFEERSFIAPRDSIENRLVQIWERILRTHPIGVQDNYFELGGNSLLAAQLFARIEKAFGKKLPLSILFEASTIEQQANILRRESWTPNWSSLVPLRSEGSRPPLFFAAPVGGNVLSYRDLMIRLESNQPCYGLQAVGLDGVQAPMRNLIDVATHYIQEIRSIQPKGPYYLAGSSFGGLAAYEMAQQLQDQGEEVALVVMFDAYGPNYPQRLPGGSRFKRRLYKVVDRLNTHLGNLADTNWNGKVSYIITKSNKMVNRFSRRFLIHINRLLHPLPKELRRVRKAQFESAGKRKRYVREPRRFCGRLVLFRASHQPSRIREDPKLGWGAVVGEEIEVYEIPGHHTSIIYEPRVRLLAEKLNQILLQTQKLS